MVLFECAKETHNKHMKSSQIIKRLGERIRELRKKKGLSSDKLAELVGREGSFIRRLETGRFKNIPDEIEKIAQVLGVSLADLLEEHDEKRPPSLEKIAKRVNFLPVVAAVRAGPPGEPVQFKYAEKTYPYVGKLPCKENECFVIEVDGDSMEPTLERGDFVLVKKIEAYPMQFPENFENKIVVAANEEWEYTIKRLKKIDNQYFLVPDNPEYPIQKPNGWHIVGIAIERLPKPEKL